jgi:hypothetical protein
MLLDRINRYLTDSASNSEATDVREQAKTARQHLWRYWSRFRRGIYVEIAALHRVLAICRNDLEAKQPNWGRIYHHLTHLPPTRYPKWDPATLKAYLGQRVVRLEKELTLINQRKARLKAQLDLEISLAGARVLIQEGADAVAAEDLALTTREKPKKLAKYITDMPKQVDIVERMAEWAGYYHTDMQRREVRVRSYLVDPWRTSRIHANCGGAVQAVRGQSDNQICAKCGALVPRHGNSAQLIAQRGIQRRQEATD